jgi:8-oxo-dGTP diphosphatase
MKRNLEVHVGTICFKDDKVLILKRPSNKRLYPEKWECGGGKIEPGENFLEACKREIKEEARLEVEYIDFVTIYEIPLDNGDKIPGVKFAFRIIGLENDKEPQISDEHTEWKFISEDEIDDYDFIEGIDNDIREAFHVVRRSK